MIRGLVRYCVSLNSGRKILNARRFARLTNAFGKKVENHAAAVAPYFMYYRVGRVHQTLRVTPAMEARVTGHVWSVDESFVSWGARLMQVT
jgi:hypothetical protein